MEICSTIHHYVLIFQRIIMSDKYEEAKKYLWNMERRAWKATIGFSKKAKEMDGNGIKRSDAAWDECAASFAKGEETEIDWPLFFSLGNIEWNVSNNRITSAFVFISSYCDRKGFLSYDPEGNYAVIDNKHKCIISPPTCFQASYFRNAKDAKEVVKYLENISFEEEKDRYIVTQINSLQ